MLLITRKTGEEIVISDNIKIVILGVTSGIAKIGIEAPREIPIHRMELYKKIQAEKQLGQG